jgi:hypothetical protein
MRRCAIFRCKYLACAPTHTVVSPSTARCDIHGSLICTAKSTWSLTQRHIRGSESTVMKAGTAEFATSIMAPGTNSARLKRGHLGSRSTWTTPKPRSTFKEVEAVRVHAQSLTIILSLRTQQS